MDRKHEPPSAAGGPGSMRYSGPVIAAVVPGQRAAVVQHAAALAQAFGTALVCAYVDPGGYTARNYRDGVERFVPINPDSLRPFDQASVDQVKAELNEQLSEAGVPFTVRGLAGTSTRIIHPGGPRERFNDRGRNTQTRIGSEIGEID